MISNSTESNPWKQLVIDHLVCNWAYKKEHEDNPVLALVDLINQEVAYALDPQISQAASDLMQRGYDKAIQEMSPFRL